jgi:hypothetical protein
LTHVNAALEALNVMIEWLTLIIHIPEVPGSNFSPETGYPDGVFRGFPQFLQANVMIEPQNYATTASLKIIFKSPFTYHTIV